MGSLKRQTRNENGNALIIVVLLLAMLTLVGLFAMNTSKTEIDIAALDKFHKIAFHNADSGLYTTPKLISACLAAGAQVVTPGIAYYNETTQLYEAQGNSGDGTFYNEVMGFNPADPENDIRMRLAGENVDVDVARGKQRSIAGSGIEFGAGIEGYGTGSSGGVIIPYALTSNGQGLGSSVSVVSGVYRKVVGTPGGL